MGNYVQSTESQSFSSSSVDGYYLIILQNCNVSQKVTKYKHTFAVKIYARFQDYFNRNRPINYSNSVIYTSINPATCTSDIFSFPPFFQLLFIWTRDSNFFAWQTKIHKPRGGSRNSKFMERLWALEIKNLERISGEDVIYLIQLKATLYVNILHCIYLKWQFSFYEDFTVSHLNFQNSLVSFLPFFVFVLLIPLPNCQKKCFTTFRLKESRKAGKWYFPGIPLMVTRIYWQSKLV